MNVKVALALAAVLVLKLSIGLSLGSHPLLVPEGELDGAYYRHFAERVLAGDFLLTSSDSFFGHSAAPFFISPLYIYVLALFLKIGGSLAAARAIQLTLGAAAVGLIALTARRWYGRRAMWIAGGLAAGCGLFTFYETLILQAALDPFLTALDLYLLTRALQDGRRGDWIAAGAVLGLHCLNRPNMLIVVAGLAVILGVRRFMRPAFMVIVSAAIVILPATIRNWHVAGTLIPISSHGGLNFLIGNGPESDGTFVSVMGIEPSIRGQWLDAPRVGTSASFRNHALAWIRDHPLAEGRLLLRKTWYSLSDTFLTLNHSFPFFAHDTGSALRFLAIGPAVFVPLGLIGLTIGRPRREGFLIWAAFVPLALISVVIFFVAARYRLPLQVALVVAAGGGAAWLIDRLRERAWRPLVSAVILAALAVAVVVWPTGLDDGRAEEQVRMGLYELERNKVDDGEAWISVALTHHGFPGVVHLRAAQVHEAKGRLDSALRHYQKALALDPDEPALRVAAARAYERAGLASATNGRPADAVAALAEAVALNPRSSSIRLNHAVALAMAGRTAEARKEAEAALELEPGYTKAREFLTSIK